MLPFDYEEQRSNEEYAGQLAERMKIYAEQGDPKYWHQRPSADGEHIEIYNDAPFLKEPKIQVQKEESLLLNNASALALWGQKTLNQGVPDDQFSLESAWSLAKELDAPGLFDEFIVPEDILRTQRRAAIAAVAYVLARHDETESWANERSGWCLDKLRRAATIPELDDDFAYRGSMLLMHPSVFAAYGYSALLARGWEVQAAQSALFNLAVDALEEIVRSVYAASKLYASAYPHFFRVLVCLGLRQCIVAQDDLPDYHSIQWDEREATDKLNLLEWAKSALESDFEPEFPLVPMSWMKADKPLKRGTGTTDYARNEILFRFDLAQKILFEADLPSLLDVSVRPDFLKFVSNLLEWTIQEIVPPGSDGRSGSRDSNPPFEWIYAFSAWCGKVCAQLTADEARACVIDRVLAFDNDKAFMMLQSVMRLFMVFAFVRVNSINMEQWRLWADLIDWLLEHRDWKWAKKRGHLGREFQDCVLSVLFCFHDNFGPVRCVVTEGWPHLPLFVPLLERSIREFGQDETLFHVALTFLEQGGFDLLPDPALAWLLELVRLKKADQTFWDDNGSKTVSLLRQLMERRGGALSPDNRAALISITDILTDNGVRGAGFLQQELARSAS